jgi:hypothetical protein
VTLLGTVALTIVGNTSAGGPIPRPMLNSFYSALTYVFPQGSGMTMVRGTSYFHGNGIAGGIPTLAAWGGTGVLLLASAAFRHRATTAAAQPHPQAVPAAAA